jgi:hypothetical protein
MARLTITLPDDVHRELRLRSASSGLPIGELIAQAIDDQRLLARERLRQLMQAAAANASVGEPALTEDEVMELAIQETHAVREEVAAERRRRSSRG